jgi:hypothetical protein
MHNLLTGGGLGDALIAYAKLKSTTCPYEFNHVKLTHVECSDILLKSIRDFYNYIEMDVNVMRIPNWSWLDQNLKNYDECIGTHWNGGDIGNTHWEMNPYPIFPSVSSENKYYIVIQPFAGRNCDRYVLCANDIKYLTERYNKIALIGWCIDDRFDNLSMVNYLNKNSIIDMIGIVSNSSIVFAPEGFICLLGCMMNKSVYTHSLNPFIKHPDWNNLTIFNNIKDIIHA